MDLNISSAKGVPVFDYAEHLITGQQAPDKIRDAILHKKSMAEAIHFCEETIFAYKEIIRWCRGRQDAANCKT